MLIEKEHHRSGVQAKNKEEIMYDITNYIECFGKQDNLYDKIDNTLYKCNFMITYQEPDYIEFAGNIISFGWKLASFVSKGELKIVKTDNKSYILYKLSIGKLKMFLTIFVLLCMFGPFLMGRPYFVFFSLPMSLVFSSILYFITYFYVKIKFNIFLSDIIETLVEASQKDYDNL